MKSLILVATVFLGSFQVGMTSNTPANKVSFHKGSFESGMQKASQEGKLLFVEFYADWCTPCKWMDKTTYTDNEVVSTLNTDFVALKLDIETSNGSSMKDEYSVRMLPTIMIFNSKGELLDRIEKTLSAESMTSLLAFHNIDENKVRSNRTINVSPSDYTPTDVSEEEELDELYDDYLNKGKSRTNYKVQVAVFTDYTEAFKKVNELNAQFMEPIVVVNDYVNNLTHYKVMMGEFRSIEEAEGFRNILSTDFGINGIIH